MCVYCDLDKIHNCNYLHDIDTYVALTMSYDDERKKFTLNAECCDEVTVDIKYCPMCGRKLSD